MKIDFKVVFVILAVFCQLYYVEGWWGGGSRSSSGSRSRTPSVRTPSGRGRWWSRSRTPRVGTLRFRTPSIRTPSVSGRGRWWSRSRTPGVGTLRFRTSSIQTPSERKPSARKPSSRDSIVTMPKSPPEAPLKVNKGQITFDAEGNDEKGSRYFSRQAHVPSSSSGITLGRGYDLKEKTESQVYDDLVWSGIDKATAKKISKGVSLSGQAAKDYIEDNNLKSFTLTHDQQKKLFTKTYNWIAADTKRIVEKSDVVKIYGETNWARLNNGIKDVLVDLRFRGDYTPTTRKKIQSAIAANDLKKFTELMSDRDYWVKTIGVPKDRFERRKKALEEAAKKE